MAQPQHNDEPTVLIVGAGTFGVSTAYHLADTYTDPSRVTILDREPSPPTKHAAAIDINRVIRADYPSTLYCNLANEAMHAWYWSNELGPHYHKVGWLRLNEHGSDREARIHDTLRARGTHLMQAVDLAGLARGDRWAATAGTDTAGFASAYFNPDAGWVNAAQATARFLATAVEKGVRREVGDVDALLMADDAGATGAVRGVRTRDGRVWTADRIVLAAGAWTSALLSPVEDALGVAEADRVERQARATACVSAYYRVSDEDVAGMTEVGRELPVVVYGDKGEVIPAWKGVGLLKYNNSETEVVHTVTTGSGRRISVPVRAADGGRSTGSEDHIPEGLKKETEALLASKLMPQFAHGKRPEYWRLCWDARTPTEDLLLCEHPKVKGLYVITGGSFCGYKYVAVCFFLPFPFFVTCQSGRPSIITQSVCGWELGLLANQSLLMVSSMSRFMPNIGKYMLNVLNGQGNGPEKDRAWGWKTAAQLAAADKKHAARELKDFETGSKPSKL